MFCAGQAGYSTQGSKLKFALAAMSTFKASLPDLGIDSTKAPHTAAVIVDANKRKYVLRTTSSATAIVTQN